MILKKNKYLSRLTVGQIITFIGVPLVDEIKSVLPFLQLNEEIDVNSAGYLKEVFASFVGTDLLLSPQFREMLINLLSDSELSKEFVDFLDGTQVGNSRAQLLNFGWSYKSKRFCERFLQVYDFPETLVPFEKVITLEKQFLPMSLRPYKQLQDYQLEVYLQALVELEIEKNRFIVQMPTGSGKTRTAVEIIVNLLNNSRRGSYVVWLAHSSELCAQAEECFQEVWGHAGKFPLVIYRCWGDQAGFPKDEDARGIVICGFDKINSLLSSSRLKPDYINDLCELIVIDEAHKAIAPTYKRSIQELAGVNTRIIGLTATPGRSINDDDQNRELSSFFYDKKITFTSDELPIIYLRRKGVLASIDYVEIDGVEITKSFGSIDDFTKKFLDELGEDSERNVRILRSMIPYCKNNKQIIYFAPSVNQSRFISSCLTFAGYKSAHVDSGTSAENRWKIIDDYKAGNLQVICNYGVLTTGFDAPKTDVVFIARPTTSIVLYSQMVGRGLRGPKVGGKSSCTLVQVKDNFENFDEVEKLFGFFDSYFR